jgi:hypothetical protein
MKKTITTAFCCILFSIAFTQQQPAAKPVSADAAFADALNKVVQDFTSNFVHIQGEKMPAEIDADTYKSKVCIPGALGCKVMRYHSVQDKTANWQAGLYEGESFDEALKFYKKVFAQVRKASVRGVATTGAGFAGKMEAVDENVGFAVSTLRLKTTNKAYKDMVAEVELASNSLNWEVRLNVYTKKLIEEDKEEEFLQ